MADQRKVSTLRLPPEIYTKLQFMAYMNRRSLSKEIEFGLAQYVETYEKEHGPIPVPNPSEEE